TTMLRSLVCFTALVAVAYCLTCSTIGTVSNAVSNAVNSTGVINSTQPINLGSVTCPTSLDRCMKFSPMNISDARNLDGVKLQINFTKPLSAYINGTISGFVCASQNDCLKVNASSSTSCVTATGSCCCTSDLCTTKGVMNHFSIGSFALLLVSVALSR
ncbi:hypothetical protein PENTCL1PPCAC_7887, partial [Pristionchus entomophagus]